MTTRKILAMIIAALLSVSLCACETESSSSNTEQSSSSYGVFVLISEGRIQNTDIYQYIMYDPETMVIYTYLDGYNAGAPTVIYNADGTPKIYSLDKENN